MSVHRIDDPRTNPVRARAEKTDIRSEDDGGDFDGREGQLQSSSTYIPNPRPNFMNDRLAWSEEELRRPGFHKKWKNTRTAGRFPTEHLHSYVRELRNSDQDLSLGPRLPGSKRDGDTGVSCWAKMPCATPDAWTCRAMRRRKFIPSV